MSEHKFKLVIKLDRISDRHLPPLIEAIRKGGRQLHADAMLILGDNPPPEVVLVGEDLVADEPKGN